MDRKCAFPRGFHAFLRFHLRSGPRDGPMDHDFYENTGVPGSLLLESDGENHGIYHDISFFWKSKVHS